MSCYCTSSVHVWGCRASVEVGGDKTTFWTRHFSETFSHGSHCGCLAGCIDAGCMRPFCKISMKTRQNDLADKIMDILAFAYARFLGLTGGFILLELACLEYQHC
jgi:hypothetical protein